MMMMMTMMMVMMTMMTTLNGKVFFYLPTDREDRIMRSLMMVTAPKHVGAVLMSILM
jgi:hypothetical protein